MKQMRIKGQKLIRLNTVKLHEVKTVKPAADLCVTDAKEYGVRLLSMYTIWHSERLRKQATLFYSTLPHSVPLSFQ